MRSGVWVNSQWEAVEELTQGLIEGVVWLHGWEPERNRQSCCSAREKPKQMRGLRGYWSSSRGESTLVGSLLSLYVTDQEKRLRRTVTLTRPVIQLIIIKLISNLMKSAVRNWRWNYHRSIHIFSFKNHYFLPLVVVFRWDDSPTQVFPSLCRTNFMWHEHLGPWSVSSQMCWQPPLP